MALTAAGGSTAAVSAVPIAELYGPAWIINPVRAVLASVVAPEDVPPVEVTVTLDGRHAAGQVNGTQLWSVTIPRSRWLEVLTGQIVASATSLLRRFVFVHAGVVETAGRACVLVGDSGSGKTSTVAALLNRGASYLSDEVALLDPETSEVWPFHIPMAVKPWTARAAGPLPPGTDVARHGAVRFRLPAALGRRSALGTVVLLQRGSRPVMRRIPPADALMTLARRASSFQHPLRTEAAFRAWVRGLRNARCFELSTDRPAASVPSLLEALDVDEEARV
jgi:hypothetical protein